VAGSRRRAALTGWPTTSARPQITAQSLALSATSRRKCASAGNLDDSEHRQHAGNQSAESDRDWHYHVRPASRVPRGLPAFQGYAAGRRRELRKATQARGIFFA
jgi:hypothetical protein